MSTTDEKKFAAIPLRALADQRLTGHHWRVLGAVAAHDRLGKNGGCWASQDTLAAKLSCSKSWLSKVLSTLRDYGYITSELNPEKRWFRVHRVIYNADDEHFWDTKSVSMKGKSVSAKEETDSPNQFPNRAKSVSTVTKLSNENNDRQNMTIVRTKEENIESKNQFPDGRNCAEARSRTTIDPDHVEDYLATCEAMAAEAAPTLTFEREQIAKIADDACLPEPVNERAAKLLARIPEGKGEM